MKTKCRLSVLSGLLAICASAATLGAACGAEAPVDDPAAKAYLAGDLRRAQRLLEKEVASGKARPSRYLFLGRVYFMRRNWQAARKTLDELLKKDPDNPRARELLGRTLFRLDEFEKAVELYEESLGSVENAELRLELAEGLIGLGRKTDATVQLRKVIEDKTPRPKAHYLLGKLRLESGLGHWASRQLWVAVKLGSKEPDLRLALARAFFMEGRVTGALAAAGPFPDAEPGARVGERLLVRRVKGPAGDEKGPGLWRVAAADTALYQIETFLAERPGGAYQAAALLLAARCWLAAGDHARAAKHAARLRGRSREAAVLKLKIALAAGKLDEFTRLLAAAPPDMKPPPEELVRLLLHASLALQVEGNLKGALALLENADAAMPGRSEVLRPAAQVLARLGRTEEAHAKARLLAELHPDSPKVKLIAGRFGVDMEAMEKQGAPVLREKEDEK